MSVLDRVLTGFKDVLLFREQLKDMRGEITRMGGNIGAMMSDMRELEQRVASLEGSNRAMLAMRRSTLPPE